MKFRASPALYCLAASLFVLLAALRILSTYHVFTHTVDEPCHLACGVEWWDKGTYNYDTEDPVLSRIAIAAGPYLDGARSMGQRHSTVEGDAILYSGGRYFHKLALARAGILPFFLLASAVLWFWCRRLFGDAVALASLFLFTTLPAVLAHAGLATSDMAGCACILAALYAFTRWLEQPGLILGLVLGLCVGLALLAKFSVLLFLPLCFAAIVVLYAFSERPSAKEILRRIPSLGLAAALALLLVWAGYRFSFGVMPEHSYFATQPAVTIDRFLGRFSLPAPEFFDGIANVQLHNFEGHPAWCLGKYSPVGWWYYFPVVLAVKTPLAFLLLAFAGYGFCYLRGRGERFTWQPWVPGACAAVILVSVMPAHINIGVRHILILYPLLAMLAGLAAVNLLRQGSKEALLLAIALLFWQGFASLHAHPDYLAYFNELVQGDPALVLSDSDLDWGQDLQRLSDKLKSLGVKEVTLICFNTADLSQHGLPEVKFARAYQPVTGWIAVSAFSRTVLAAQIQSRAKRTDSPLGWLDSSRPVAQVGKSIELYYIPPNSEGHQPGPAHAIAAKPSL